ncbi:MAG: ABC transporter ATP-binding protein [Patescibacteria group bacterium]
MKEDVKNFSWWDVPKAIWYFLENDRRKFIFFTILLSSIFFYTFVPPYVTGKIIDLLTIHSPGDPLEPLYGYVLFIGGTYIAASLIRLYSKMNISIMGQRGRAKARIWGFERLTEFSLEWHSKENIGSKIQRIFTGADSIKSWLGALTKDILKIFADIVGAIIILSFIDYKLAIVIFVYTALFLSIEFTLSKKILRLSNEFNKFNQAAGGVYVESASNLLAVKALGSEQNISARVANREEESRDMSIKRSKAGYSKWYLLQFINGTALMFFLFLTAKEVIAQVITIGTVLVAFAYFFRLRDGLGDFSNMHSDLIELRSDLGNMMPIFRETEFIKRGNETFPRDWKAIEIKNANMDYGSGQMGMKDFNLTLTRNTKTGIAGLSGSGKSTLAKIILGLYALESGEFKIGNKNYYSISHNETLSSITVVLQETELFNLSLRDNITMMRSGDSELLNQATEISQLGEVIAKLPEGLDAKIGEKGYMLSGGERQRLGIARAIYKNAPIIILDEATSSLDSETEGKIMEKLLGVYGKDKTFLIIAHRLGTLKYTDKIAVMERGQVVEEGAYDELMNQNNSVFRRMNKEQKVLKS